MKAFAVTDEQGEGEVTVLNVLILVDREASRQGVKEALGSRYVWFEDEIRTDLDPLRGPNPQFGPEARRNRL